MGKKIIFLPECHSTNDELTELAKSNTQLEGTILYTDHQSKGKGQRGNSWKDEPGKNILMSILLKPRQLPVSKQYLLNLVIGLAVAKTISRYLSDEKLKLKWPNDVMLEEKKVSGILIENSLRSSRIENSVVGIGINLNQEDFDLPNATSLIKITHKSIDRLEFMENLVLDIEHYLGELNGGYYDRLRAKYHGGLYLIGESAEFEDGNGRFHGRIRGIDDHGRLVIDALGQARVYQVKEVVFLTSNYN